MTATRTHATPVNAMTVDVEDYFQVQAFANCIARDSWDRLPSRVEKNTMEILERFARRNVHATFFTLGWVAERFPAIVRHIVAAGHELASHGYGHELVHNLTPMQFRDDLSRAKSILEEIGGCEVKGYRAPTFSIGPRNSWAFEVLDETGHTYSSSVYPVRHDLYGNSEAPRFPYRPGGSSIVEIPMTTLRLGSRNLPISGGGYFRLLPYAVYRAALSRFSVKEDRPSVFYFHPWEIDAGQPRVSQASRRSKFRHYVNIAAVPGRLDRLLQDFRWGRMDQVFASELVSA
jgi:polysaccharide deacetylase family protein (PEP-CTERM system associated)